ncbi:MAG: hypothetical protein COT84_04320 [Chlamydiae bacterium CG10_big_fil_rev_8_21_14_0_10_35_9]|nr:MAG: hypothetical protein COT84_04320 [Chlamydiae bacterium CG10_big_fil_rev_8_21_14_0_10_35_9]
MSAQASFISIRGQPAPVARSASVDHAESRKAVFDAQISAIQSSLTALEGMVALMKTKKAEREEGQTEKERQAVLSAITHLTEAQYAEACAASNLADAERLRETAKRVSEIRPNVDMPGATILCESAKATLEKAQEETQARRKELEVLMASKKEGE